MEKRSMESAPKLILTLKPVWANDAVASIEVTGKVSGVGVSAGESLVTICESTVNIPFSPLVDERIDFADESGVVPATRVKDPAARSFIETSSWVAERNVEGAFTYTYRVLPRVVPEDYRSSPLFDLRAEKGGINGAGMTFLALPKDQAYALDLRWDLSEMPDGADAIWSLGKGNVVRDNVTTQQMWFTYYATGLMHRIEKDGFGLYWFDEAPFAMEDIARYTSELFAYMADFFRDEDRNYTIIGRRDPFEKSGGGTALPRSFIFGYNENTYKDDPDRLKVLLAHEMVHNWPHISDEPAGLGTWYNEGMAEFYSTELPYRAGLMSLEQYAKEINRRAKDFYSNVGREVSNEEAAKRYWQERHFQRIPYGRGFFYIANTDAAIRKASGGQRSVDDVMLAIHAEYSQGVTVTPERWIELVSKELGEDARPAYEAMRSGQLVVPDPDAFGGLFEVYEQEMDANIGDAKLIGYQFRVRRDR